MRVGDLWGLSFWEKLCAGEAKPCVDSSAKMVAPPDGRQDCLLNCWPVVHHSSITHTQDRESLPKAVQVAGSVRLAVVAKMVTSALELEHKSITDQDVETAHSVNADLRSHPDPVSSEP